MASVLFNPTSEVLKGQHIGETVTIQAYPDSGHLVKVDDARAKHILNVLGPRGLCVLNYGDTDEKKEEIAKDGRKRNKAFKRKQVIDFNEINQGNEQRKLPYLHPAKFLKEYADELGMGLLQPYSVPDEAREKISGLTQEIGKKDTLIKEQGKEVSGLRDQVSALSDQVAALIKTFKQPQDAPVANDAGLVTEETFKFRTLNKQQFNNWLRKNWDDIPDYSDEMQTEINARHEKLFEAPLPNIKPE